MVVLLGYCRAVVPAVELVPLRVAASAKAAAAAAGSLLGVGLKCQSQTETEDAGEIQAPICRLFNHICLAVSFSQVAADPGCPYLTTATETAASANRGGRPLLR